MHVLILDTGLTHINKTLLAKHIGRPSAYSYENVLLGYFHWVVAQRDQIGHALALPPKQFRHQGQAVKYMNPQDPGPETSFVRGPRRGISHVSAHGDTAAPAEGPLSYWSLDIRVL